MNIKKIAVFGVLIALMAMFAGPISTQEEPERPDVSEGRPQGEGRHGIRGVIIRIVSEETGMRPREIIEAVREGYTLQQIIESRGGDFNTVTATIIDQIRLRIQGMVETGNLSPERAAHMLENMEERINAIMRGEWRPDRGEGLKTAMMVRFVTNAVSNETGLSHQEIRQTVANGNSLSDILSNNGVIVADFSADVLERFEGRVQIAVENDRITTEQARQMIDNAPTLLATVLNHVRV